MHILKAKIEIVGVNMKRIIPYYVEGHTGKGYVNLIKNNVESLDRMIILTNKYPQIVRHVLQGLKEALLLRTSFTIEEIRSLDVREAIDGLIIREIGVALLHENLCNGIDSLDLPLEKIEIPIILSARLEMAERDSQQIEEAYRHFRKGLALHEQLEKVYIQAMDFKKADQIIERLLDELLKTVSPRKTTYEQLERLFGTNTPYGIVNTVPELIAPFTKKIFITGRAGTGKSHIMQKVMERCEELSLKVEVYRCSLDPDSIDMLLIRELEICLHDNTSPHTVMVEDNVQVIDMYKETVDQEVENVEKETIEFLQKEYKKEMQLGLKALALRQPSPPLIITGRERKKFQQFIKQLEKEILT